jgi:hypothetical protein
MVEGSLERAGRLTTTTPAAAPAAASTGRLVLVILGLILIFIALLGCGGLQLGGDQCIVLGAKIDLVIEVCGDADTVGVGTRLEILLALERLNLLNGYLELMRDPGVGSPLADPGADAVQLWS